MNNQWPKCPTCRRDMWKGLVGFVGQPCREVRGCTHCDPPPSRCRCPFGHHDPETVQPEPPLLEVPQ